VRNRFQAFAFKRNFYRYSVVLVVQPPFLGFPASKDDGGDSGGGYDTGAASAGGGGGGSSGGYLPTHASYGAGVAAAFLSALMGGVAICTVGLYKLTAVNS
jgi:hypothetical protein